MATYWCELAWVAPGRLASAVTVTVDADRITALDASTSAPEGAARLAGLVLPGLANTHSHAFHRALRARTHGQTGDFWTWRQAMYELAERLDPDAYLQLARATFAEMALAGVTSVGEFHYLHHQPTGAGYPAENIFGHALVQAARDAGIRIALLDTCYLAGGFGAPPAGVQRRFADRDAAAWAQRVEALHEDYRGAADVVVGAAVHSVRAVPAEAIPSVAQWAERHDAPLHAHVSEQRAENEECLAATGRTPTQLLYDCGALGSRTAAVHANHATDADVALLAATGTTLAICPTTERDLADGVGPARRARDAGVPVTLGSDSNAVVDLFEEARALEMDERARTGRRGHWRAGELLAALSADGHRSLGFPDAGSLYPGARADLVAVDLGSVRTAGAGRDAAPDAAVFAATAADVTDVVCSGRRIVRDRAHLLVPDVAAQLAAAIRRLLP